MLSDTKRLEAIFSGICALAEKITGERMTIYVETGDGQTIGLTGTNVSWVALDCFYRPEEPRSKLATPAGLHGAIEQEPAGFVRQ